MSTRTHMAEASGVSVVAVDRGATFDTSGEEPVTGPALVFEDGGNQEAWVLTGTPRELLAFARAVLARASLLDEFAEHGR